MSSSSSVVHSIITILANRREKLVLAGDPADTIVYRQFVLESEGDQFAHQYLGKENYVEPGLGNGAEKLALKIAPEMNCEWGIACVKNSAGDVHTVIQCHQLIQASFFLVDDPSLKVAKRWSQSYALLAQFLDVLLHARPPC